MEEKHVHIVSFDIPFPANYGGVIDVYHKILALRAEGVSVHLHAYEYGRARSAELQKVCESVNYYRRDVSRKFLFTKEPYIVASRASDELVNNLAADSWPVIYEGLHCTYHLNDKRLRNKKKIVRAHNVEHDYYSGLAKAEPKLFKKYYFLNEAGKLKRYETQLRHADLVIAITPGDAVHFRKFHKNVITIPAFHTYDKIEIREGIGKYAIYHGNLSVPENVQAASYLISRVFNDLSVQLVITGNKPTRELKTLAAQYPNIDLKPNPSSNKISGLIRNAHINILPTFQSTGIKLKLLASLFGGRHCIVNSQMVDSTGLESQCIIADSDQEMKDQVVRMMDVPFDEAGILDRRNVLLSGFSNTLNAQRMVKELF